MRYTARKNIKNLVRAFLFFTMVNQRLHGVMLNYVDPVCTLSVTPEGTYKIEVEVKVDDEHLEEIEERRETTLVLEAKKDPLFTMAFIQKLASDGDEQALDIQAIYQGYVNFFESGNKDPLLLISEQILERKGRDPLAQGLAKYLNTLLKNERIDFHLEKSRALMNMLIPGIEQTLTMNLPYKMYAEQQVAVPEMEAQHNAFPDVIRYEGSYYATFREANTHVGYHDFGKIRILKGEFNEVSKVWKWENVGLLARQDYDLRDPKFFINSDHILQLMIGGSKINEENKTVLMTPHVAILKNGEWLLSEAIVDPSANGANGQWIWRVTWNPIDNQGYAFSYGRGPILSLVKTADGILFEKIAEVACEPLMDLSEGTLRFKSDGSAVALIRGKKCGVIGTSSQNEGYAKWSLQSLPFRVGGPNFLISKEEGQMWAATRHFFLNGDNTLDEATIIGFLNEKSLVPAIRLKSHSDNSYPGMVLEDDGSATLLYYSSDLEGKSHIYVTRIKFPDNLELIFTP